MSRLGPANVATALLMGVSALLMGCGDAPVAEDGDAYVVAIDQANAAIVEEDTLTFPLHLISEEIRAKIDAYDKDRGWWDDHDDTTAEQVLLVSGRQNFVTAPDGKIDRYANNPWGFIRRALSYEIEGHKIIIDTEQATLADVWRELSVNGSVPITADGPRPPHDQTIYVDESGIELWKKGSEYIRFPSLWVSIDPTVDLDLSFGLGLKRAAISIAAQIESEIIVEARVTNLPEQALKRVVYDQDYKLAPLGLVPVSLRVKVEVGCTKTGGGMAAHGGVRASAFVKGALRYERATGTKLSGEGTFAPKLIAKSFQVTSGDASTLSCVAKPLLTVMLYDLPTGSLAADVDLDLALTRLPKKLTAHAGARAEITGVLKSLAPDLADAKGTVFDIDKTLHDGPVP